MAMNLSTWGAIALTIGTVPVLAVLIVQVFLSLRKGNYGLDLLAALSMSVALVFGEYLAAAVVALMYSGGQWLESYAQGRAQKDMTAILQRVPRTAARFNNGQIETVSIDKLQPGDEILVKHGEVIPTDGRVKDGSALVDNSALTGEAIPVSMPHGEEVMSGATLSGPAVRLSVIRPAQDSTYAGIVRLVESAKQSKAPMSRMADRYSVAFLLAAIALSSSAWILSGEPIRFLSVLVIATPCPLILAVPVAFISGMSKAARKGVIIKSGEAIEALAAVRTAIFDKTGTLTEGRPKVVAVRPLAGYANSELLRLAASLDQASTHVVAKSLIDAASRERLALSTPTDIDEEAGSGLCGLIDGRKVCIGGREFIQSRTGNRFPEKVDGSMTGALSVAVAIDGSAAGFIELEDRVRPEAISVIKNMKQLGIGRMILASGDRLPIASEVAEQTGITVVHGDLLPEDKLTLVRNEVRRAPVIMIGDGVNDAPALAEANVGVAMGARGAAASSEAANVVLVVDRIEPIVDAIKIAQRTKAIALQSITIGIGLSMTGMIVAALGYLAPLEGAVLQEIIDVTVILNALRALR